MYHGVMAQEGLDGFPIVLVLHKKSAQDQVLVVPILPVSFHLVGLHCGFSFDYSK
jgi:hypothetical protein